MLPVRLGINAVKLGAVSQTKPITFGTDGWRGIIADDFTFANVCRVTRAIARYLETAYSPNRPVLIAYDTRFLADQFAQVAAEVLVEAGWHVKIVERDCPTPVVAYSAKQLNSAGALMFTASHNPASYCGIKYIPDYGGPATTQITDAIVANLSSASDTAPNGKYTSRISSFDPRPSYLTFLYSLLDIERIRRAQLSITYDALYSTSLGYLDAALQHCGCRVEILHAHRDVLFGNGIPEPKGKQLAELIHAVKRSTADVGVATDGDSDRFGIVDEQGTILSPNTVLLLLARHLHKHKGKTGAIVRTVATTHLLDNLAEQYGLPLYETAVGFKHIGEKMRETTVLLGGEESGGLSIHDHIPEKDGILANLLVIEAIAYENKPLSQLSQEAIIEAGGPLYENRIDLALPSHHKAKILEYFADNPPTEIAGIGVKAIGYRDGIKLYLKDRSWVLLRPSGTEPLLRVSMEVDSPAKIASITEAMHQIIHTVTL